MTSRNIHVYVVCACLIIQGILPSSARAAKDAYLDLLTQGIDQIKVGQYNAAVDSLDQALALQPGETVGRLAMGLVLTHTRKIDAAIWEYNYVLQTDPGNAQAAYGLGVCYLAQGNVDQAAAMFKRAGARDNAAAIAYVAFLRGQGASDVSSTENPAEKMIQAAQLRRQNRSDEAQPIFAELSRLASATAYDEDHGAIITLDVRSPVSLNAESLTRLPAMRISAGKSLPKISGQAALRPDAKLAGAQYISIIVDGAMAGMMNSQPYTYTWDTTRLCNGMHTIVMQAQNENGDTLDQTTKTYWVQNEKPGKGRQLDANEAAPLMATLWDRVKIKPSIKLASYYAGSYLIGRGDLAGAAPYMEKAAACDPNYADARALLAKCYGRKGFEKFSGKPGAGKVVAITFDDGPNPSTQALLDILNQEGVKATFFLVGSQVRANPAIVKTMSDEGFEIECHTYSHNNLLQLSETEVERELLRGAAAIRDATGKECALFRPPGGHLSAEGEAAAAKYGFTGVFWTLLCSSYEASSPEKMTEYVASSIQDGAVVLMHDGDRVTLKALPAIISDLKGKGYAFVTVSELIGRR